MAEKFLNSRIVHKHDTEANWIKATNFIPLKGEIIIYDIDSNNNYERVKIGDGENNVNTLPFVDDNVKETLELLKNTVDSVSGLVGDTSVSEQINTAVENKVDKVSGKGLSTNDYTAVEKDKLSGIATGAEVNQNTFSNVKVGFTTIAADSKTDTLELVGSNVTLTPDAASDKVMIGITKSNVTAALGYTPPTTNTTYGTAGSSLGLVKSGGDVTIADGVITVNDDSHAHVISNVDGLQSALDGKAASSHGTHVTYDTTAPAMDGTATAGSAPTVARSDHKHPTDTSRAAKSDLDDLKTLVGDTKVSSQISTAITNQKGKASGLAELDSSGKVPSAQLPSYVDDVIEGTYVDDKSFKNTSGTVITGETGKIYVDTSTNKTYRWSGSSYSQIKGDIALGTTSSTAYRGDYGNTAYQHSQSAHARTDATKVEASTTNGKIKINGTDTTVYTHPSGTNPHGTTKSDVGLGNVGNFKAVSTVASQGLSDTEKTNARNNIGAGTPYTHPNSGVTAGTYKSVTVNAAGHVTSGSNPTTLAGYGITDAAKASDLNDLSELIGGESVSSQINSAIANKADNSVVANTYMTKTDPTGTGSFSMNRKSGTTVGTRSFAQGYDVTASGTESMAIGYTTKATATGAFASGGATTASGAYSYSGGRNATASADSSWAFGNNTLASGIEAHAEGRRTQATGDYGSHAEGMETYAKGYCSHTEGYNTTAVEGTWNAHAEGQSTSAGGDNSHAEGDGTIANSLAQHVQGQYNIADPGATNPDVRGTYAHIVGNGTDEDHRSNAHTLDWDGNAWYAGDLTVAGTINGKATKDGSGNVITSTYATKAELASSYMVVTVTGSGNDSSPYVSDKTFASVLETINAGKSVILHFVTFTFYPMEVDTNKIRFTYQFIQADNSLNCIDFIFRSDDSLEAISYVIPSDATVESMIADKVGDTSVSEQITAAVANKANSADLTSHTGNKSNPHSVTKSQIGLSNVPNVATNDQTPTYSDATTFATLTSGEKLSVAMAKVKLAITNLINHIANKSNPHGVTKNQVGLGNVENKTSETIRGELTKANVTTALGYTPPTTDTTYNNATTSAAGLMSSADKTKLDNISELVGDTAVSTQISNAIANKADISAGQYAVTASSTDGVAYTATVPGITALTSGISFIMIPGKVSSNTSPTLNVNGLGAKPIRRRLSGLSTSLQVGYTTTWLSANSPFRIVYDASGTGNWVVEGHSKPMAADLYGAVAKATGDGEGNNIIDTYATIAMLQSMLPKVTNITLGTEWSGSSSPYYQDVALSCVTETSMVDIQPSPTQLASWQNDGIAFTTASFAGTVRVYVSGTMPTESITVQVKVQEVSVI